MKKRPKDEHVLEDTLRTVAEPPTQIQLSHLI